MLYCRPPFCPPPPPSRHPLMRDIVTPTPPQQHSAFMITHTSPALFHLHILSSSERCQVIIYISDCSLKSLVSQNIILRRFLFQFCRFRLFTDEADTANSSKLLIQFYLTKLDILKPLSKS